MLRRQPIAFAAFVVLALTLAGSRALAAAGSTPPTGGGGSCTTGNVTDPVSSYVYTGQQSAIDSGIYTCTSGNTYVPEAIIVGGVDQTNTAVSCTTTNAGMIEYTSGGGFQGCNGTSFGSLASGTNPALSSLTSGTVANTIDSTNFAQTWKWGTLTTQTALTFTTSSMTGGTLLSLQDTAAAATSTGYVLSVTDATTGTGYGIYSALTSTANTGYALYGANVGRGYALGATGTSYFNGNVGIGTSAPSELLQLSGGNILLDNTEDIRWKDSGGTAHSILGYTSANNVDLSNGSSTGSTIIENDNNSGTIAFATGTGPTIQMIITATGPVGIGTTSPGAQLDLIGTTTNGGFALRSTLSGLVNTGYAGYFSNTVTTTGYALYANGATYLNGTTTVNGTLYVGSCVGCSAGASASLSSLTSGTVANTIDSTNFAQTWKWGTLTTQTALTLTTSSMKGGTLLSLQDTAAAATSTGDVLSVTDASTGVGYGIHSSMTGHGNTGYAGYFRNTDTGADANYGIYATNASATGYAGYFTNTSTGYSLYAGGRSGLVAQSFGITYGDTSVYGEQDGTFAQLVGVQGLITNSTDDGSIGVEGSNFAGSGNGIGVGGSTSTTGSGIGVYGNIYGTANTGYGVAGSNTGVSNTGYAGYFSNTSTGTVNYSLYASTSSTSGYAGYFQGKVNVNGVLTVSSCTGCSAGSSAALSSITSATTTNSIDSTNNAITWKWGTLGTQTALTLSTSSMTSGTLLALTDTSAGSGGTVLNIADSEKGTTYGVSSSLTGAGNTGYGGYFSNTSTAGWALAATGTSYFNGAVGIGTTAPAGPLVVLSSTAGINVITGTNSTTTGSAVGILGTSAGAGAGYGVAGVESGTANTGAGGAFSNTATTGVNQGVVGQIASTSANAAAVYGNSTGTAGATAGVVGVNSSTGSGYGVYGVIAGAANTGYGGYFTNTSTSGTNYGVYATNASGSGYGGYFANTSTGYALYANGGSYFSGTTTHAGALNATATVSLSGLTTGTIPSNQFLGLNSSNQLVMGGSGGGGLGFVGMLTMVGKSGCNWTITTAWAGMSANSSCNSLTATGSAVSPGKFPAIEFASLPAGTYKVTFNIAYDNSDGCAFRIFDGTNTFGEAHVISTTGDYVSGIFSYSSAQTNITFSLQGKSSSSNSCTVYGDAATTGLSVTDFTYSFFAERIL